MFKIVLQEKYVYVLKCIESLNILKIMRVLR